jgi:putative tryptophan/tyrosine transport system substrate-binding protein
MEERRCESRVCATLDKQSPIQAVCGKAARTVLCGGRGMKRTSLPLQRRDFIAGLGAAAWPVVARAQQPARPVIGLLHSRSAEAAVQVNEALREGLRDFGFVEGRNVSIEYRFAAGHFDLLPALAADLVSRRVAVIAAAYPAGRAAKAATSTIPIVFIGGSDPVEMGLVASINRPGSNVTGVSLLGIDVVTKRLGLLREVVPQSAKLSVLIDRTDPSVYPEAERMQRELRSAAGRLGVSIEVVSVAGERDFDAAFDALLRARVGGLIVAASVFFNINRDRLVALSRWHRIPTIYELREFADAGGLMTYAPSNPGVYRLAGGYIGRILKGEKPEDLPILLPTKFEFVINLKTAKALDLTIPETLLATADEVIQ